MSLTRIPLVAPAVSLAAGIALTPWVTPDIAWPVLLGALIWAVSLVVLDHRTCASVCLLVGVAAAGALRATDLPLAPDHLARHPLPVRGRLEGRLVAEPVRLAPERLRLVLEAARLDGQAASGRLHVTAYGADPPPLTEGQRVELPARLHRAAGFRNPDGFDYADFLRREGVLVVGSTRAEQVTALEAPSPPWHVRARRAAKETMVRALPPASAALLNGLLLGDRTDLPHEMDEAFRRAGVYHVLAVSGFNVALVGGAVWVLLVAVRAGRVLATVGAMAAVVAFALVAGLEPSVLRAVIMSVLVLGALLLDREASLVNSLALAALLILAVRPGDLRDPGFQLSFAATAAIVLMPLPRSVGVAALVASVAAQLGVMPVSLTHFNQLSTLGPLANLAAVPIAGAATVLGLLALTSAFVTETAADILLNAAWPLLLVLRAIAALVAAVPGALVHLPAPHWTAIVAYCLGLALSLVWWRSRQMGREMAPHTPQPTGRPGPAVSPLDRRR